MKSLTALGVGLVVALAPGTAFAAPAEFGTGVGNAYGNCQHSSATGNHDPLPSTRSGNGNGGHVLQGKKPEAPCAVTVVVDRPGTVEESPAPPGPTVGDDNDETGSGDVG